MNRRLLLLSQRALIAFLLICLGCSAQSAPSDLVQRIQREVRAHYNVPAAVSVDVGPLTPSEFPDFDATSITLKSASKTSTFDFIVSKDRKQLIRLTRLDLSKDPYQDTMSKIDLSGRPTRGNKDAKVTLVNFDDFECPYCARMHETLSTQIFKEYGDKVQFVYKDFPLSEIHPWAMRAAVDANCLGALDNDAYWDYADYLHAHQREISQAKDINAEVDRLALAQGASHHLADAPLQACIKAQNQDAVKKSMKEAESVGVSATPTMFINGQELDGAVSPQEMRAALDGALTQAGVTPPDHSKDAQPSPAGPGTPATQVTPDKK